jgi:hypothetical protein
MEGVEEGIDIVLHLARVCVEPPQWHLVWAVAVVEHWRFGWGIDCELDSVMGPSKVRSQEAKVVLVVDSALDSVAAATEGASVACIEREVLWRTLLEGWKACRK